MSDSNKHTDKAEGSVEKKSVLLQGRVSTDVSADERNDALSSNPNKSDGSLQKYADKPIARSIEIHAIDLDGKPVRIDKDSIHKERSLSRLSKDESDSEAKAQRKKHERISRSVMMLAFEAKENPVMQPVHLAREYADKLPENHPDKQKLTEMARHQAAEFSPSMRSYYQHQDAQLVVSGKITSKEQTRDVHKSVQEKPLENNLEGWQRLAQKIADLTPDQQFKLVTNLIKEQQAIEREKAIGALVGTVQGTETVVMDICNVFQFAGDCLVNPARAQKTINDVSVSLWNASVAGVQLLEMGALYGVQYTGEVIEAGDIKKPLNDAYKFGQFLEKEWDKKTPFEQERLKYKFGTEALGAMIPLGPATKLGKAGTVAEILKVVATDVRAVGGDVKVGAKAFANFVNELTRFGDVLVPAGHSAALKNPGLMDQIKDAAKELKDKFDELHNKMGKPRPGDKPGKGKYHYEDQGPPEGYRYKNPGFIEIGRINEHPIVKEMLKKVAKSGAISEKDGVRVCDVIAESLREKIPDIDTRNIAFAVLKKDGNQSMYIGISKKQGLPGIVDEAIDPVLPITGSGDIDVRLHSEYKILEALRRILPENAVGSLALFTEQIPCRSCEPAIDTFRKMFKNITFPDVSWKHVDRRAREDWNLLRTNW